MIGLFLGKGLEGCGVTKYAIEMVLYLKNNNIDYKVFVVDDKKYSRKTSHDFTGINIEFYKSVLTTRKNCLTFDDMINDARKCDTIIVLSMPVKGYKEKTLSETRRFFEAIKDKNVVLTHHNHSSLYTKKEILIDEVLNITNTVFTHSSVNPMNAYVVNKFPKAKIFNLNPSMFVNKFREYHKDCKTQDSMQVNWVGRTTPWKGYDLAVNFHNNHLRQLGFKTSLYGMDKGPAFIGFKTMHDGKFIVRDKDIIDNCENLCEVHGPYIQNEMLETLSKSGFTLQLTKIKPRELFGSYSLEFTHIEALCAGAVPVFRKEHGQAIISRKDDRPIIEHDTGILWLSDDNQAEIAAKMKELSENIELREEHIKKAFNFAKEQCDSSVVFNEFFRIVKEESSNLIKKEPLGELW